MIELDLMAYRSFLKVKTENNKRYLFDPLRSKWLVLQPEELVRQLVIHYLIREKHYNKNRMKLEKGLNVNTLAKRCDVLVYDPEMNPFMLIECKAPHVDVSQRTFRQIASYNLPLQVPYLLMTNGITTYCCKIDAGEEQYEFLNEVPDFPSF